MSRGPLPPCAEPPAEPAWFDSDAGPAAHARAKRVCAGCPTRAGCLDEGVAGGGSGVFGGLLLIDGRLGVAQDDELLAAVRLLDDEALRVHHVAFLAGDASELTRAGETEWRRRTRAARRAASAASREESAA